MQRAALSDKRAGCGVGHPRFQNFFGSTMRRLQHEESIMDALEEVVVVDGMIVVTQKTFLTLFLNVM